MCSCTLTTPTSRPLTEYSVTGDREPMEKFEGEDEMLEKYEVYMKMLQLFKDLPSSQTWKDMLEMPYCKEHLKVPTLGLMAGEGRGFSLGPVRGHWGMGFLLDPGGVVRWLGCGRTRICLMPQGVFCFSQKVLECYARGAQK